MVKLWLTVQIFNHLTCVKQKGPVNNYDNKQGGGVVSDLLWQLTGVTREMNVAAQKTVEKHTQAASQFKGCILRRPRMLDRVLLNGKV